MPNRDNDTLNLPSAETLSELAALLLEDPGHAFSLGVQGALAEFMRSADEPGEYRVAEQRHLFATRRGAIAIDCSKPLSVHARESFSTGPGGWRQSLDVCLDTPTATRAGCKVITELGPDRDALNSTESSARLFDLGLGIAHVDVCISSSDAGLLKRLREHQGQALFTHGSEMISALVKASPRRVFISAATRIEVDTPIPLDHSPEGPHTHLLPERLGRPEANACADTPGKLCVLSIYPAHPCRDLYGHAVEFEDTRHAQFQSLLRRYGPWDYVEYKQQVLRLLASGAGPEQLPRAVNRMQRSAARLALRQAVAAARLPQRLLAHWCSVLEPARLQQAD